jgi:hypothetical protein
MLDAAIDILQQGPALCAQWIPPREFHHLYRAMICGHNLEVDTHRSLFLDSGLIHLMVVSGAHIMFLEKLMFWLPRSIQLVLLGFYCWVTGWGAPVVRAFVRRTVSPTCDRDGWTSLQAEALTTFVTLAFVPLWFGSRSFMMSWICALVFCLPPLSIPRALDIAIKAYLLLFLFTFAHPVTVFWNALIAPAVGFVLFPMCLLSSIVPVLEPLSRALWSSLLGVLEFGPTAPPADFFLSTRWIWWLPFALHIAFIVAEVKWRRAHAFS